MRVPIYIENIYIEEHNVEKPNSFTAKVISHGRITIPDDFRHLWNIVDGDLVAIEIKGVHKMEASN